MPFHSNRYRPTIKIVVCVCIWWLICAMLYKRVLGRKCKKAPRENPPNGDFFVFSHAKRKYATFHALRFRLLFVVSLPGGAKGRHAKTRHHHHLAGFRLATFRVFAPKTRLYDIAQNSYHNGEIVFDVKNLLFKPQLVIF